MLGDVVCDWECCVMLCDVVCDWERWVMLCVIGNVGLPMTNTHNFASVVDQIEPHITITLCVIANFVLLWGGYDL